LEGDLTTARVSKADKDYAKALATLETILARDPDFPDALLLKAQVLWEGFADEPEARKCVIRILHHVKDKASPVYRWAGELYKEISKGKFPVD
jgi:tetratricopeptide (TPR) repeat protein